MKVLLDIENNMAIHLMEILNSLPYVKTKELSNEKAQLISEVDEAVQEMALIKQGKIVARNVEDFINEL